VAGWILDYNLHPATDRKGVMLRRGEKQRVTQRLFPEERVFDSFTNLFKQQEE